MPHRGLTDEAITTMMRRTRLSQPSDVAGLAHQEPHDLMIGCFHLIGLVPLDIATVLYRQGWHASTWNFGESFVRGRLAALGLKPNLGGEMYPPAEDRDRPWRRHAARL